MQSHDDSDARESRFAAILLERAKEMVKNKESTIASGKDFETILESRTASGIHVQRLPDDPQGILRISIGGGFNLPVNANYVSYRGNKQQCLRLLRKAIKALEAEVDD